MCIYIYIYKSPISIISIISTVPIFHISSMSITLLGSPSPNLAGAGWEVEPAAKKRRTLAQARDITCYRNTMKYTHIYIYTCIIYVYHVYIFTYIYILYIYIYISACNVMILYNIFSYTFVLVIFLKYMYCRIYIVEIPRSFAIALGCRPGFPGHSHSQRSRRPSGARLPGEDQGTQAKGDQS